MEDRIKAILQESIDIKKEILETPGCIGHIKAAATLIIDSLKNGGKILVMGNGGSAADAQHLAAEMIGRFAFDRKPLPAIALTTDTSIMTAVGNDYGYEDVFIRQVDGLANKKDVVIGISTSGNSKNVVKALQSAKEKDCALIGMTGESGGKVAELVNVNLMVPVKTTARVQEAHITYIHIICELVEEALCK